MLRTIGIAFLAVVIAILMISPLAFSSGVNQFNTKTGVLAPSNYSENLNVYLTASETFWNVHLSGGNINVSSVAVPSSVNGFSITLTNYASWQSDYELFTQYGFGLLGNSEPFPNGAVLTINATSSSDASSLATSLSQRFALAFVQTSSTSSSFTFFSPINFATEFNVYFYKLVPRSAGGFATMFTQSQLSSNNLNYYQLSYSSSTYSLTIGGLTPLVSPNFTLYGQLGLAQSSYNYSSLATSSTIDIHVLGGLVNNSTETFANHVSNISSSIEFAKSSNNTIPNVGASLDFSFPTILAYRTVSPTLTPSSGSSVTVAITVENISPTSGATANNVFVNDSWIDSQSSSFHLTQTQTSNKQSLAPSQSFTVIYAFNVIASSGTFTIPSTPVTYEYQLANNKTGTGEALLNPETIVVGGTNTPELEARATIAGGSQLQAGVPYSVNVTITNKGSGAAFGLTSSGLSKQNLPAGSSWSYISNQSSNSLTQINASLSYSVNWQDAGGISHSTTTNTINTILGFAIPGTPALSLSESVGAAVSNQANVTLAVFNNTPVTVTGSTIKNSIPSGATFVKSYNSSSIQSSGGLVTANLSSIGTQATKIFIYTVDVSSKINYIFLPANVSTVWNGQTIIHFSGGYGLPLGVVATKVFTPNVGFQGSNESISIGLLNQGTLPIYQVVLNNSYDPFVRIVSSNSSYAAVLNEGGQLNALLNASLTGAPGVYNSSSSAASFIFAGTNQTATSSVVTVTIFHLPEANLTYSATKVEEAHNIVISVTITNPSNVTISNVSFTLNLPKYLKIESGGVTNFTIPVMGPNSNHTNTFTIITDQPNLYQFNSGKLTFDYQGHRLSGIAGILSLNINDDVPIRYGIPVVIGLAIVIGTILYVRRLTSIPSPKK
ncbi:MAG TPA: hypothetical protein VNE86_04680 [Nitrososphaerales archaeon]|nr:hypothetical protein [Nitrososphaerales archaeon]